jgi:hypothetical protein
LKSNYFFDFFRTEMTELGDLADRGSVRPLNGVFPGFASASGMFNENENDVENKLNEVKRELCYAIRAYADRRRLNQRDLAFAAGASEHRIGHVIAQDFKNLRVEQLFRYLTRLHKGYRILISL